MLSMAACPSDDVLLIISPPPPALPCIERRLHSTVWCKMRTGIWPTGAPRTPSMRTDGGTHAQQLP